MNCAEELEQTKLQLQTAAEFGSALLEKNQHLEAEKEKLENYLQLKQDELQELRKKYDEQAQTILLLKKDIELQNSSSKNMIDSEVKSLKTKYQTAMEQIKELTNANKSLTLDVDEKNTMLIKYRGIDKELLQHREEYENLVTEKEEVDKQIIMLTDEKNELKRNRTDLKIKLKKEEESYDKLQLENSELKLQITKKGSSEKGKLTQILKQLDEAEQLIEKQEKTISDIKYEKKQLEKTVTDFAIQNQQLHKERDENQQFLEETRKSLATLRKREEEKELIESVQFDEGNSLLGELEHEFESRIHIEEEKPLSPPPDAPENCEEFFFLAATAIKIAFAVQAPRTSDGCFRINIKALYQQALKAEVPFHEWYDWIKLQLASKQESLLTSVTSSPSSPVNKVNRIKSTKRKTPQTPPTQKKGWLSWLNGQ